MKRSWKQADRHISMRSFCLQLYGSSTGVKVYKISQDLKKPLQDITNLSNEIIDNPKNIEEKIKIINTNAKQLYTDTVKRRFYGDHK